MRPEKKKKEKKKSRLGKWQLRLHSTHRVLPATAGWVINNSYAGVGSLPELLARETDQKGLLSLYLDAYQS